VTDTKGRLGVALTPPARSVLARLGGRDFTLLWGGTTVSACGTAVTTIALPLVAVVALGASTLEVGFVSSAGFASWLLLGLTAGVLVDRLPRRPLLVACDLVRAAAIVSVPLAWWLHLLTLGHLVGVAFVVGVATVFFDIGFQTYLPSVVDPDQLVAGNSKLQGSESAAYVGGPALGGALTQAVGAATTLLADVGSYLVSACCLLAVRRKERPTEERSSLGMVAQIREGLGYVRHHPILRPLTLAAASLNFSGAAVEAIAIVFLVRTVELSPGLIGVLLAASGVGGVLGAALVAPLSARLGDARALLVACAVGPVLSLLIPLTTRGPRLALYAVGVMGINGFTVVFSVLARSYRQLATPPRLLGRVTATIRFVSWGVLPIGALIGGALGTALGNRAALWAICLASLVTPLPVFASPNRRLRDFPTADQLAGGAADAGVSATPGDAWADREPAAYAEMEEV
jgi:MFS family permease